MKVFVTGATGFVGAHVARALVDCGDEVHCLVRASSPRDLLAGLRIEPIVGDLASLVQAIDGCAAVYHCAADYRLVAM